MAREGCEVSAVCPPGHPLAAIGGIHEISAYRAMAPLRSIAAGIAAAAPDFIVPCDDVAVAQLGRLHRRLLRAGQASAHTCALIERSLGSPVNFPIVTERASLIRVARRLGIRAPATAVVRSSEELHAWLRHNGLPAVLKADGTSGGRGVRVVQTADEAERALAALSAPPSLRRALKRAIVNRDTNYVVPAVWGTRAIVNAQAFVAGRDANCTVACWKGRVLGHIAVEVLQTMEPEGPASVVKLIDHRDIDDAVHKIVGHLGLSGIVGFDFVLQRGTGDPYLIEMNPRATQTGHLRLGPGRDLAGSLSAVLSGEQRPRAASVTASEIIAYFPQECLRDAGSRFLSSAYHDVPWDEPNLIVAALANPFRARAWSAMASITKSAGARAQTGSIFQQAVRRVANLW